MSRRRAATMIAAVAIVLGTGGAAAAWDPGDEDEPLGVPFEPLPFELASEAYDTPAGIYAVTDAYTGDYVIRDGAVTTYGTATVHGPTDTYARVVDTVATGAGSIFDGAAFNGRSALTDGRPVAGTFYESFFRIEAGFVSLGIVFFQDDAETARSAPTPAPAPSTAPPRIVPPDPASVVVPTSSRATASAPAVRPVGVVTPQIEVPAPRPTLTTPAGPPPPIAGGRIEVLRGRRTEVWLGALPAGAAWRFTGGEAIVLGASDGSADEPFVARWDRLAAPGATSPLSFVVVIAGAPPRALVIEVAVLAPGLVE